ncbi:hypothetical protein L6Q96_08775 [Candidatus Binatia bacterium]|nr:hypothetical protein [Candidatus Binatia bacterium]
MKRFALLLVLLLAAGVAVTPALAGIADWPLPTLVAGKKTLHVYSVSGVGGGAGGLFGTYFSCTSTDTTTIQVGVEVFNYAGGCPSPPGCAPVNNAVATSLAVDPGETVLFAAGGGAAGIINVHSLLGDGGVVLGSARILSTSRKLVCSAFLADRLNVPPSMVYLTIVKKTTQKGQ